MPRIYFEKQEAALCAQHMLNNLLQGRHFDAGSLAEMASLLDQQERQLGLIVDALRNQSQNVDESGNFSIQVLEMALESFQIKLNRDEGEVRNALKSVNDVRVQDSGLESVAFVFNQQNHWYAARWLYREFWVLDSMKDKPEPVSRFELSNYIKEMRERGWSVFVTKGRLPPVADFDGSKDWYTYGADALGKSEDKRPKVASFQGKGYSLKDNSGLVVDPTEDPELALAIQMSRTEYDAAPPDAKAVQLADEPGKDGTAITIQLVLPGAGKRVRRRFDQGLTADQLYAWAKTFPEVQSGQLQSIQRVEDRADIKRSTLLSELGNGCSVRAVMF